MKQIRITYLFTIQRASREDCDRFDKPYGTIEIIDPEGERLAWAKTEQAALDAISEHMADESIYAFNFTLEKD